MKETYLPLPQSWTATDISWLNIFFFATLTVLVTHPPSHPLIPFSWLALNGLTREVKPWGFFQDRFFFTTTQFIFSVSWGDIGTNEQIHTKKGVPQPDRPSQRMIENNSKETRQAGNNFWTIMMIMVMTMVMMMTISIVMTIAGVPSTDRVTRCYTRAAPLPLFKGSHSWESQYWRGQWRRRGRFSGASSIISTLFISTTGLCSILCVPAKLVWCRSYRDHQNSNTHLQRK